MNKGGRVGNVKAVLIATEMIDVQVSINSCLTVINSTSDWMDVESASKSIKAAAHLLGVLSERVAEL